MERRLLELKMVDRFRKRCVSQTAQGIGIDSFPDIRINLGRRDVGRLYDVGGFFNETEVFLDKPFLGGLGKRIAEGGAPDNKAPLFAAAVLCGKEIGAECADDQNDHRDENGDLGLERESHLTSMSDMTLSDRINRWPSLLRVKATKRFTSGFADLGTRR